jgi:[ribosomal protein S18]-alanine N-acetyltransferase
MTDLDSLTIEPTTDPVLYDRFAAMMANSDPWMTLGMDAAACRAGFQGPCKEIFVATLKNEPAGLAILQVCGSFNGYIQILFVAEAFRGRGFGKRLLAFCEERILQHSPNVFICVSTFNTRALRLYEKSGFTPVGKLTDFVKPGYDEWLLRKTVGPTLTPPSGYPPGATPRTGKPDS